METTCLKIAKKGENGQHSPILNSAAKAVRGHTGHRSHIHSCCHRHVAVAARVATPAAISGCRCSICRRFRSRLPPLPLPQPPPQPPLLQLRSSTAAATTVAPITRCPRSHCFVCRRSRRCHSRSYCWFPPLLPRRRPHCHRCRRCHCCLLLPLPSLFPSLLFPPLPHPPRPLLFPPTLSLPPPLLLQSTAAATATASPSRSLHRRFCFFFLRYSRRFLCRCSPRCRLPPLLPALFVPASPAPSTRTVCRRCSCRGALVWCRRRTNLGGRGRPCLGSSRSSTGCS